MGVFALAGLQLDLHGVDNLERIGAEVAAVKRRLPWLDMVVLPELCAYGPRIEHAQVEDGPAERSFRRMAAENHVWLVAGSMFQRSGEQVFNTCLVIDPAGAVVARYRKMYPFRPYEEGVSAGDQLCVVPIEGVGRIGIAICYDLWFPEIARSLAWLGAEALIFPTLTNSIDRNVELAMARATAASNQCYVLSVNVGAPLGMGQSIACGPGGEVIHQASSGFEVVPIELDFEYVARVRRQGWQGLGQPLKSFRDSKRDFPAYRHGAASPALEELGALTKPDSLRRPEQDLNKSPKRG